MKQTGDYSKLKPRVVVIGASENPSRYSYKAVNDLVESGFEVFALGRKIGRISGHEILVGNPEIKNVHTVTLYLRAEHQKSLYDYILSLNPQRIIFNPGAENLELNQLARAKGIETENACTLVMLRTGVF